MKKLFKILGFILFVFILTACLPKKEKISLKLNLQKGDSYGVQIISDDQISPTILGQTFNIKQKTSAGYRFDVEDVDANGNAHVKATHLTVLYEADGLAGKILYDSTNPPEELGLEAAMLSALLNKSFNAVFSPEGEVKEVSGIDAILDLMVDQYKDADESEKEVVKEMLSELFGDDASKERMGNMFNVYPDKPVAVGDSWSVQHTFSVDFPEVTDSTYKLKKRKNGIAIIEVSSVINVDPDSPIIDTGDMKMSFVVSGEQTGTIEVDEKTGWIIRSRIIQNLSGKAIMEESSGDISWPISIKTIMTQEPLDL